MRCGCGGWRQQRETGERARERQSPESARGKSCSLSLSLSLSLSRARAAARPAGRESAEAALEPATGPQTPQTHTSHARQRERGASEHSLSHRDYKVFKRNYNRKKKYAASEPREQQGRGSTPHAHTRHLDLPTPARARHTAPARAPADGLWGHNRSAPVDPPGTRRHTSSPPARWPVQGYQFLYINYTPSAMSHVDVRQHIDGHCAQNPHLLRERCGSRRRDLTIW